VIAFTTYGDSSVWIINNSEFNQCGNDPFAISASGNTIVARERGRHLTLAVTRFKNEQLTRLLVLLDCLEAKSDWFIDSVRCDDNEAIIQAACSNFASTVPLRWARITLDSLKCEPAEKAAWDHSREALYIRPILRTDGTTSIKEYNCRNGIQLIERIPRDDRGSIIQVTPGAAAKVLLREDAGVFWKRYLANSGFKYP